MRSIASHGRTAGGTLPSGGAVDALPAASVFPTRAAIVIALLAVALRLWFWFYTGRTWEDALITVQHAENAARGLGLTHTPQAGPPLHGFTSPLSVLIPLAGEFLHAGFGLPLLKLLSALLGGVSAWLGIRIAYRLELAPAFVILVGGFLAIEHHQILYGMAGMETQVTVTILLFSFYTMFRFNPKLVGLALGLSMLVRPDFAFWVAIALALAAWRCWRRRDSKPLLTILAALLMVYGPWLIFTTWYYGSPVPNTILAKAYGYDNRWYLGLSPSQFWSALLDRLRLAIFGPLGLTFGGHGTGFWPFPSPFPNQEPVFWLMLSLIPVGCFRAWLKRDLASLGICGFVAVYSLYYMFGMTLVFGWYVEPLTAAAILACACGADLLLRARPLAPIAPLAAAGFTVAYLFLHAMLLPISFRADRNIQEFVENGNRKVMAEYLAGVTSANQTIGCEPLGYIGYYSRRIVFDYPGLCNRKVTQFMREHRQDHSLLGMLKAFQPDYVVLRPRELPVGEAGNWLRDGYDSVREFRVPEAQVREIFLSQHNFDLVYFVFKRKPGAVSPSLVK